VPIILFIYNILNKLVKLLTIAWVTNVDCQEIILNYEKINTHLKHKTVTRITFKNKTKHGEL